MRNTKFSQCRKYRYALWRQWHLPAGLPYTRPLHASSEFVQFIGLNPSTANETQDDPTIRRCIGFAKAWGYSAMCMTNVFGFVSAYPEEMMAAKDPVGENDSHLLEIGAEADLIVAAWGNFPCAVERGDWIKKMFPGKLHHLGLNQNGSPKHPLYLPKNTKPIAWK